MKPRPVFDFECMLTVKPPVIRVYRINDDETIVFTANDREGQRRARRTVAMLNQAPSA